MLIKPEKKIFFHIKCELPSFLMPWVIHQDSLTERLHSKSGHTRLEVLKQCWELPDWWDKHVLRIDSDAVLHREILMWAGQEVCWYARTIIPKTTYQVDTLLFNRLQEESLGSLIFNESRIKRLYMTHYPISDQSIEYHWLNQWLPCVTDILWVRMAVFTVNDVFPFFLIETLLPTLERYSQ